MLAQTYIDHPYPKLHWSISDCVKPLVLDEDRKSEIKKYWQRETHSISFSHKTSYLNAMRFRKVI